MRRVSRSAAAADKRRRTDGQTDKRVAVLIDWHCTVTEEIPFRDWNQQRIQQHIQQRIHVQLEERGEKEGNLVSLDCQP